MAAALLVALLVLAALIVFIGNRASESALIIRGSRRESAPEGSGPRFASETGAAIEDATVQSAEGHSLSGWLFTPPRWNGSAVLLVHGFTDCRATLLEHARLFLRHGYAALAIDNRGHGASGGMVVTFGVLEAEDVRRWGAWLCDRLGVDRYFLFGQSMGAAISAMALERDPRIAGAILEACFTHFDRAALRRLVDRHAFGWKPAQAAFRLILNYGYLYGRVKYGVDLRQAHPARVIRETGIPTLLIHGSEDRMVPPECSRDLHALNPVHTQLWEVQGAAHTASITHAPQEYERRVSAFFTSLQDGNRESIRAHGSRPAH